MRTLKTKSASLLALPAFAVALIAGCYPKAGPAPGAISPKSVEWASAKWPSETEASLTAGRDLFLAKCNACHGYPDLVAIPEADWPSIAKRMAGKAELPPEKGEAILHYVLAEREFQASVKPAASH